jgi:hypothetical protein
MPALLDIAPSGEVVKVWGADLDIPGLSAAGLVHLWTHFPALQGLFDSGKAADPQSIMEAAPGAIAAIIAAGTGAPGCPQSEAQAAKMPIDSQLEVLTAIVRVSMPQGLGPFVERLMALVGGLGEPDGLRDLVNRLPAPSSS